MNKRLDNVIHSRTFIVILIGVLLLTTLLVGTYAWFTWSSTDNTTFVMTIGEIADVYFTNGNAVEGSLYPVFNYYDGLSTSFSVNNRSDFTGGGYSISFDISSIDSELISKDVKVAVVKDGVKIKEIDLYSLGASNNSTITLYSDVFVPGTVSYVIYFYIDGNVENDPSMMGRNITGHIIVNDEINLVDYITNLYLNNNPTLITQENSGDTYYYTSSDIGLMNDGMDSTGNWSNGINDGNIRYYGADPNNYIDIGDRDTSGNVIPWRIIGVFKNVVLEDGTTDTLVKIIRSAFIGTYSFDNKGANNGSSTSANGSNYWPDSRLMMLLNPGYEDGFTAPDGDLIYNYPGSLYWNSSGTSSNPGKCYSGTTADAVVDCYFDSKGLSADAQKHIETVVWNLGAKNSSTGTAYPDDFYVQERGNLRIDNTRYLTWTGKIALFYPSDYGFATDLTKCGYQLNQYGSDTTNCRDTSWLNHNGTNQWTLTPLTQDSFMSIYVAATGNVSGMYSRNASGNVRPTMYLRSNVVIGTDKDGSTVANAFVIK